MKLLVNVPALALCVILAGSANAQTVTVQDSDFETPVQAGLPIIGTLLGGVDAYNYNGLNNGVFSNYLTAPGTLSGWYVSQGTVTLVNQGLLGLVTSPITGDASSQYLALNGLGLNLLSGALSAGGMGGISQVISTTVGQTYLVSYQAGALSVGVATSNTAALNAGVDGVTVTSPSGGALISLGVGTFSDQSFTFTATGTQSTLDFYEPGGSFLANVAGVAIDNVSVTAVPEPSHYAAILIGCVMLISVWRRARGTNVFILRKSVKI